MGRTWNFLTLFAVLLAACTGQTQQPKTQDTSATLKAESWLEADGLFSNNPNTPQWKGADVANSVALEDERILWVFGDTLLGEPGINNCSRFDEFNLTVHNSLAIQSGANPAAADIDHFWGIRNGEPASFFSPADIGATWYWMGGVTVLENQVLVFLMHARSNVDMEPKSDPAAACAGLNFEVLGWDARIAHITEQAPDQWHWREVGLPDDTNWHGILAGSSTAYVEDNYLYAWSAGPATLDGNPVFLARWPLATAKAADLSEPEWHTTAGWKTQSELGNQTFAAIVKDGNNEVSIGRDIFPDSEPAWWWLQSSTVINSRLCYRTGESHFEFSECRDFMTPPELYKYPESKLLVYAVKLHPALKDPGDDAAIATYVVNSCDLKDIQEKCDLYYPRFIKLRLEDLGSE